MTFKRIFLIVCDSMGIGHALDAHLYNDEGSNTLKHICDVCDGLNVSNMEMLGLGKLDTLKGVDSNKHQKGYCLKLNELSNGKDTMTGHYEMMGLKTEVPFVTFTDTGFPDEFIQLFEEKTGRHCVGNIACSGTDILDMYGKHQKETGDWIVYTSADSVFQIAANEDIIPLEELYQACHIARSIAMTPQWKVGRIIARPYIENDGKYIRTANRHDYALEPFGITDLDLLKEKGLDVIAVGKISDIFVQKGITKSISTVSNHDGMIKSINLLKEDFTGLAFINLVDFDAMYGHRRNPQGYKQAIEEFDVQLTELINKLKDDDLLMICADHGNDPTYKGTDHTREQVPLLIYSPSFKSYDVLEDEDTFGIIGATILDNFNIERKGVGLSILDKLK